MYPDYTLLLPLCAAAYVRHSGDQSLITDYAGRWAKLASGVQQWLMPGGDLVDAREHGPYIDLSHHRNREPVSVVLNVMFVAALEATADLLDQAGVPHAEAADWRAQADRTRQAIREHFFDASQTRFADLRVEDDPERTPSIHGNVMTSLYGLVDDASAPEVMAYLCEAMHDNLFDDDHPDDRTHCRINAYFSHYLLELLAERDRHEEALSFIRDNFGRMVDGGAWTSWEYFVVSPGASLCHAWAAAPTWFLSREVLGVRIAGPDEDHAVRIEPHPAGLTWARGRVPHPQGVIEVRWERAEPGQPVRLSVDAPEGVRVEIVNAEPIPRP
jgi:hypothetical protein